MLRKPVLVVLVTPLWILLSGCTMSAQDGQAAQAILGAAAQLLQGANGQTAAQPIASSVTAPLPGAQGNGQGAPAPFANQPFTLQSGVTPAAGSLSAPDNAFTLASTAAVSGMGKSNDGRLTLTQYGGPTDRTPDDGTRARQGNRNNTLRASSLALSPNLIREYGLRGGEAIYVQTAQGNVFLGTYDDTTGNSRQNNVIDVYDPGDRLGRDNFLASIPAGGWKLAVGPRTA